MYYFKDYKYTIETVSYCPLKIKLVLISPLNKKTVKTFTNKSREFIHDYAQNFIKSKG